MNCKANREEIAEMARDGRWLNPERRESLRVHLERCTTCQTELAAQRRFVAAALELARETRDARPLAQLEAVLLAEFEQVICRPVRRRVRGWASLAGSGALAAALLLAWGIRNHASVPAPQPVKQTAWAPHKAAQAQTPRETTPLRAARRPSRLPRQARSPRAEPEQPFVAIPFTTPLAPGERTEIVRADLPFSALIAAGFPLQVADPSAKARADLVVTGDGRARAVRLLSISNPETKRSLP